MQMREYSHHFYDQVVNPPADGKKIPPSAVRSGGGVKTAISAAWVSVRQESVAQFINYFPGFFQRIRGGFVCRAEAGGNVRVATDRAGAAYCIAGTNSAESVIADLLGRSDGDIEITVLGDRRLAHFFVDRHVSFLNYQKES
jgi:hypothetical protein